MSLWQKVKGLFTGGAKSGQGLPLKKTKKEKRKDVGHTVGMFLLIFVALVMVSEVTLAIINLFFWDSQSVGSFVVPIAIMPVIALALTGIIIWRARWWRRSTRFRTANSAISSKCQKNRSSNLCLKTSTR